MIYIFVCGVLCCFCALPWLLFLDAIGAPLIVCQSNGLSAHCTPDTTFTEDAVHSHCPQSKSKSKSKSDLLEDTGDFHQ
jgi:hypothetical protein